MPPRYAYWTILIDSKPTAFRATKQEELLPTLTQLQRTNKNVIMKWFARGKLWENPEQAQWAGRNIDALQEKRGSAWRPGGTHEDPRARFDRKKRDKRGAPAPSGDRPWSGKPRTDHRADSRPAPDNAKRDVSPSAPKPAGSADRRPRPPFKKPFGSRPPAAGFDKPFRPLPGDQTHTARPPRNSSDAPPRRPLAGPPQGRPYDGDAPAKGARPPRKPYGDRGPNKPYGSRPPGLPTDAPTPRPLAGPPRGRPFDAGAQGKTGDRPQARTYGNRPASKSFDFRPAGKSFRDRPPAAGGADRNRPWTPGARAAKTGDRPWSAKPPAGGTRPWSAKPPAAAGARPWSAKPASAGGARPWSAKPPRGDRPERPPFKRDARRPAPKPFGKPAAGSDATDKKRRRNDDES